MARLQPNRFTSTVMLKVRNPFLLAMQSFQKVFIGTEVFQTYLSMKLRATTQLQNYKFWKIKLKSIRRDALNPWISVDWAEELLIEWLRALGKALKMIIRLTGQCKNSKRVTDDSSLKPISRVCSCLPIKPWGIRSSPCQLLRLMVTMSRGLRLLSTLSLILLKPNREWSCVTKWVCLVKILKENRIPFKYLNLLNILWRLLVDRETKVWPWKIFQPYVDKTAYQVGKALKKGNTKISICSQSACPAYLWDLRYHISRIMSIPLTILLKREQRLNVWCRPKPNLTTLKNWPKDC